MARFPRVHGWLEQLLHTHDTAERTAAAYALGVFFGFSPFLGLHTVLGLICAFAFRLNRVAVLLGVYSNLPWIILPYYSLVTWGVAKAMGIDVPGGTVESLVQAFEDLSWTEFRSSVRELAPFLWAFALGSTLGALVLALAAYRIAFAMVSSHRKHRASSQPTEM